ncbi:tetratricopeptide repeat protein [Deltaproteobacteria bacterium IMCC39524]|nr:tetratricopeptide repeat protein [Deltaproteobacteria bacterium IMCC39524]
MSEYLKSNAEKGDLVQRSYEYITRHSVLFASALLMLFSLSIYSNALDHELVWDDAGVIVEDHKIRDFSNIPSFFVNPLVLGDQDAHDAVGSKGIRYYRPLISTLHTFEYSVFGINPLGYKIINLLLNGLVVVCAFLLVRALTGEAWLSFLAALLYAANPVRSEVVYWVYSDSHLLGTLFFLVALLAYHYGRTVLAFMVLAAGLLCLESVILFPVVLLIYHLTVVSAKGWRWQRFVPFAALVVLYLVIRQQVAGVVSFTDLSFMEIFRALAYLSVKYIKILIVTDAPVTMYRFVPGMFSAGGAVTVTTYVIAGFCLVLGGALFWFRRAWFFWFAWFFVLLSIYFNVGGVSSDYFMAEKSLYLAALGPCVLVSALVLRMRRLQWVSLLFLLALVGYQAWTTVDRGRYWTDTVTYLEKLLEFEPDYHVAQYQLGVEYLQLERYDDAIHQFDIFLTLRPGWHTRITELKVSIYEQWGKSLADQDDLAGALKAFNHARELSPRKSTLYNGLGIIHFLRGEQSKAAENWRKALRLDPGNKEALSNLELLGEGAGVLK